MAFNSQTFKSDFPLFQQKENQTLAYLDNAATTQTPQCVIDAISYFYCHQHGNAGRSSHRLARAATDMLNDTRQRAANFLGASNDCHVAFTSGATAALNYIAHGLAPMCQAGDNICLPHNEHHANLLPWQRLAKQQGCELRILAHTKHQPNWHHWQTYIDTNTRILCLSAASNVLGQILDISILKEIKTHYPQLIIVLDASQLASHRPIHADDWPCDFIVCSAHKFYGPTGIGLLYGKAPWLNQLSPLLLGGEMVERVSLHHYTISDEVTRLEAGTSPLAAIAGLNACLAFWQRLDRINMQHHEEQLTQHLYQQLSPLCQQYGLELLSSSKKNTGIATLIASQHTCLSELGHWLDQHNIAVRVGQHCAQTLWQEIAQTKHSRLGLRISLAAYNDKKDIARLLEAIEHFFQQQTTHKSLKAAPIDEQQLIDSKSWQARLKCLKQWGQQLACPDIRKPSHLVKGCEANVWFRHQYQEGKHYFDIDSDATIIKGLAALLLLWFNAKDHTTIIHFNLQERCTHLGLEQYLSHSRMNAFTTLAQQIKAAAIAAHEQDPAP